LGTDVALAFGGLKSTGRYKRAHSGIRKAKDKYKPAETIGVGHSLGSTIINGITSKGDKVYGVDGGYTFGQKTPSRTTHYRTSGDVVSLLGANATHTETLDNPNYGLLNMISPTYDAFQSHNVENVKGTVFV